MSHKNKNIGDFEDVPDDEFESLSLSLSQPLAQSSSSSGSEYRPSLESHSTSQDTDSYVSSVDSYVSSFLIIFFRYVLEKV